MKKKYEKVVSSRKDKVFYNLQELAKEYEKLLNKKFCYIFQEKKIIEFQFKRENFYHLLGFHKLGDVSVVKMIERNQMKKEDFYLYVLNGAITLDTTDTNLVTDTNIVSISETEMQSVLGEIKANRFAHFSEQNVLDLLSSDPVIDFEKSECDTLIDADKIFFKFNQKKRRNLDLFIGYNKKKCEHFVSTFFLEVEEDKFLQTKNGDFQPTLNILSRCIINTQNNKVENFEIRWENVRREFIHEKIFHAQDRLKTWINSNHIEVNFVKQEIVEQQKIIVQYTKQIENLNNKKQILELIQQSNKEETKETAVLELMDLDFDLEDEVQVAPYLNMDIRDIKAELQKFTNKLMAVQNKMKKYIQYLPDLMALEIKEVIYLYQIYFPSLDMDPIIIRKMLDDKIVYGNCLAPVEFEKMYLTYQYNILQQEVAATTEQATTDHPSSDQD